MMRIIKAFSSSQPYIVGSTTCLSASLWDQRRRSETIQSDTEICNSLKAMLFRQCIKCINKGR